MELYGDLKEEDPPNMPPPLGRAISMTGFVDADHAIKPGGTILDTFYM